MKRFKYLILDIHEGGFIGTNCEESARSFAMCDDYFVAEISETGESHALHGETLESFEIEDVGSVD